MEQIEIKNAIIKSASINMGERELLTADLRDAVNKLDEGMKGTIADYKIVSVSETKIIDVYPYNG